MNFSKKWAGTIEFEQSLEWQKDLKKSVLTNSKHTILGFEPSSPVISLGLRADSSHIFKKKLKVVKVRRGGEASLHSPGQLVIYPVISLKSLGLKVKDFIIVLQDITQTFLKEFGIETKKGKDFAGLYTDHGKIAFFGIHISQGVGQSGLSLNNDNDLSLFQSIKSCGEFNRPHDKIRNYKDISTKQLFFKWCRLAEKKLG